MPESVVVCHSCGASEAFDGPVPRRATCNRCSAELRCCRNCRFYEPDTYNECHEPVAERVVDKESSNFCDFFVPAKPAAGDAGASHDDAHSELEKLFGEEE